MRLKMATGSKIKKGNENEKMGNMQFNNSAKSPNK